MPKIAYIQKEFAAKSLVLIDICNEIVDDYRRQGYDLTLRQLYYQLVSRDYIANNDRSYSNLGYLVSEARMAGLIDWNAINDRTRYLRKNSHWEDAKDIIKSAAASFQMEKWRLQRYQPEVWVEKDALVGVVGSICVQLDVPYTACRGYMSQSEMWSAGQRLRRVIKKGNIPIIYHLGDHDPSGMDMTRDITERLYTFVGTPVRVRRLALNWDQIQQYNPPPNPAKLTDSRSNDYIENYGDESWELDALSPAQISDLIEKAVLSVRDEKRWDAMLQLENLHLENLKLVADKWRDVTSFLGSETAEDEFEDEYDEEAEDKEENEFGAEDEE